MYTANDQLIEAGKPRGWSSGPLLKELIKVLRRHKLLGKRPVCLHLSFIGPAEIKKLNARYRGENRITDILSFEQPAVAGPIHFLGDLVICTSVVRRQAKQFGHSIHDELAILLCHGLLHLLGYDHERGARDFKKMAELEVKVLSGITLSNSNFSADKAGLIARAQVEKSHYGRHR